MSTTNNRHNPSGAQPDNPLRSFEAGTQFLQRRLYDEAENQFRELIATLPSFPGGYVGRALAAQGGHRWNAALAYWEECIRNFPGSPQPEWLSHRGNILLRLGHTEAAEQLFEQLTKEFPLFPGGYVGTAKLAQMQQDWEQASQWWDTCLQQFPFPEEPLWLFEKGQVLLKLERNAEAVEIYKYLASARPDLPDGEVGLALAAQTNQDFQTALQHWDYCLTRFPDTLGPDQENALASLYMQLGRFEDAERIYRFLAENYPDDYYGLTGLAWVALQNGDIKQADFYWKTILQHFWTNPGIRLKYVNYLIEDSRHSEAQALCREGMKQEKFEIIFALLLFESLRRDNKDQQALDEIESLEQKHPESLAIRMSKVYSLFSFWTYDKTLQAIPLLEEAIEEHPDILSIKTSLIEAYIKVERFADAERLLKLIPERTHNLFPVAELLAWEKQQHAESEEAKTIVSAVYNNQFFPGFHASISLDRIDSNPLPTGTNRVFLFCPIRDNVQCLPWFLAYYRNLGIERFFFIDNDSRDGTTEYLLQQPDVHLFWTADNFKKAHAGMRWINELIGEYGENNWRLFVDSYEALVFPGMGDRGLNHLLEYMDRHNHEAMFAFMLDMHPGTLAEHRNFQSGDNPLNHSPYFCNEYRVISDFRAPYRCVKGGIRQKLFQTHEMLEKVPLTKGGAGIRYIGNHNTTPARISDVTGVLLHFNFTFKPQLLDQAWQMQSDSGIDSRYGFCKARYSRYREVFSQLESGFSFLSEATVKFQNSEQLVRLGLMRKPDDY